MLSWVEHEKRFYNLGARTAVFAIKPELFKHIRYKIYHVIWNYGMS